jgi:hypothetical protein
MAWSSGSLMPGMIGHVVMDIGLFAFWWTGIAGDFTARPIQETGVDHSFVIACMSLTAAILIVLLAIWRLWVIKRWQTGRTSAALAAEVRRRW